MVPKSWVIFIIVPRLQVNLSFEIWISILAFIKCRMLSRCNGQNVQKHVLDFLTSLVSPFQSSRGGEILNLVSGQFGGLPICLSQEQRASPKTINDTQLPKLLTWVQVELWSAAPASTPIPKWMMYRDSVCIINELCRFLFVGPMFLVLFQSN